MAEVAGETDRGKASPAGDLSAAVGDVLRSNELQALDDALGALREQRDGDESEEEPDGSDSAEGTSQSGEVSTCTYAFSKTGVHDGRRGSVG